MNGTDEGNPASQFHEIRTLADLDDAIDRIAEEDTGWGVVRSIPELGCEITFDLAEPSTVKVRWRKEPTPVDYSALFGGHLPQFERRIDWCRAVGGGVWEVFRLPQHRVA